MESTDGDEGIRQPLFDSSTKDSNYTTGSATPEHVEHSTVGLWHM